MTHVDSYIIGVNVKKKIDVSICDRWHMSEIDLIGLIYDTCQPMKSVNNFFLN